MEMLKNLFVKKICLQVKTNRKLEFVLFDSNNCKYYWRILGLRFFDRKKILIFIAYAK